MWTEFYQITHRIFIWQMLVRIAHTRGAEPQYGAKFESSKRNSNTTRYVMKQLCDNE